MTEIVQEKKCPYCQEVINPKATVCKHCHSTLSETPAKKQINSLNSFKTGFIVGVFFMLVLILLYYLHISSA